MTLELGTLESIEAELRRDPVVHERRQMSRTFDLWSGGQQVGFGGVLRDNGRIQASLAGEAMSDEEQTMLRYFQRLRITLRWTWFDTTRR